MAETLKNLRDFIMAKNITSTGIDVGTTSTQILAANDQRRFAVIVNDSDTPVYLALGQPAVLNAGIRINENGGIYEINWSNPFTGVINGIHGGTGTKRVTATEGW